ncbi:hypothetical protein C8J57DRAFT_1216448 [Mycena rebaudengoi]|nr:hypothetical protein C8J57DRAFT_1216448 [Mycena rebaudengoi]
MPSRNLDPIAFARIDCLSWVAKDFVRPHHLPPSRSIWRCPWRWTDRLPCSFSVDLKGWLAILAYELECVDADGTLVLSAELFQHFKAGINDIIERHDAEHHGKNSVEDARHTYHPYAQRLGHQAPARSADKVGVGLHGMVARIYPAYSVSRQKTYQMKQQLFQMLGNRGQNKASFVSAPGVYDAMVTLARLVVGGRSLARCEDRRTALFGRLDNKVLFGVALYSHILYAAARAHAVDRTEFGYLPLSSGRHNEGTGDFLYRCTPLICGQILSHLDLPTIRNVAMTCRHQRHLAAEAFELHMEWLLEPFGLPWPDTRWMMLSTDSCISGAMGLLALYLSNCQRRIFSPTEIDFYTTVGHAGQLMRFFYLIADYFMIFTAPRSARSDLRDVALLGHIRMRREGSDLVINIFLSTTPAAALPICRLNSPLLMNRVDAHGALCYYPHLAFSFHQVLIQPEAAIGSLADLLALFRSTTYANWVANRHVCGTGPPCPTIARTTGDTHCFYAKFESPAPGSVSGNRVRCDETLIGWGLSGPPCIGNGGGNTLPWAAAVFERTHDAGHAHVPWARQRSIWLQRLSIATTSPDEAAIELRLGTHFQDYDTERRSTQAAAEFEIALRRDRVRERMLEGHYETSDSSGDAMKTRQRATAGLGTACRVT